MSRQSKHVWFVIVTQAGCLAVGLWMQHRYIFSATTLAARELAWTDIETDTQPLVAELIRRTESGPIDQVGEESLTRVVEAHRPRFGSVTIVDPKWRVVFPRDDIDRAEAGAALQGQSVQWTPSEGSSVKQAGPRRGEIVLRDGPHIAVAYALANEQGHVLIHQPTADLVRRSVALVEFLPALGVMTFFWTCAMLSIAVYVVLTRLHEDMNRERSRSATGAIRQAQNLVRTRDAVIFGLAKLAESRDPDTGDHLERISVYCTTLASVLRRHPKYQAQVTPAFVRVIRISSALHDIGKVGVEDRILLKPGPLTVDERAFMQAHTAIGGECLREIEQRLGGSNFLQMAREIAFCHHEKWDGTGYPKGLAGEAIPLSARIVAIADIYDALSSRRVYKEALTHEACLAIICNEAGKKLDPALVELWMTVESKFRSIAGKYADVGREGHRPGRPDLLTDADREVLDLCSTVPKEFDVGPTGGTRLVTP